MYFHILQKVHHQISNDTDIVITVFALSYNVLRLIGGFGAKGFN